MLKLLLGRKATWQHCLVFEYFCETIFCLFIDTMDNWDEKKLEEVVNKKHGEAEKKKPKTQIVCPFFYCAVVERINCRWVLDMFIII